MLVHTAQHHVFEIIYQSWFTAPCILNYLAMLVHGTKYFSISIILFSSIQYF